MKKKKKEKLPIAVQALFRSEATGTQREQRE
jgi:hypothetical protein